MPPAVALVGFMGAGKTTVGRELANSLGWEFADLDDLIVKRTGRSVEAIFGEDGEAAFRRMECIVLRQTLRLHQHGSLVLALGGGAFTQQDIQSCLREAEIPTVFLDASAAELFRRCDQPGVERPLRRHAEQFGELYRHRRPDYMKAAIRIDTTAKSVASIAQEIIVALNLQPEHAIED
jgi:shikimate kinase